MALLHVVKNREHALTSPHFITAQTLTVQTVLIPFLLWVLGALRALEDPGDPREETKQNLVPKQITKELIDSKLSFSCLLLLFFF